MEVLVLDGNQRAALAVTRSLGRRGYDVTVADETARTLAGASRFALRRLQYPSPYTDAPAFIAWAQEAFTQSNIRVALPVTEVTTDLLVRHRHRWAHIGLPFASIETIDGLSNKVDLYERAKKLQISVPRSVVVRSQEDLHHALAEIGAPGVMKPARSRIRQPDGFLNTSVVRVDRPAVALAYAAQPQFSRMPFLYQEVVAGEAQGVSAIYNQGTALAFFSHRRLREKPSTGGVSVYSESCIPDPILLRQAKTLLDDAKWHGVAMVEFKGTHLMEVNARFWGSLQLAVDAGLDIPALLMTIATGKGTKDPSTDYRTGRRLRWLLGDLDRLYIMRKHVTIAELAVEIGRFLTPDPRRTRHEVFRWADPLPGLFEIYTYIRSLRRNNQSAL
jgi:predicted ATP-grasp superfamily ATP-dependent carboligase